MRRKLAGTWTAQLVMRNGQKAGTMQLQLDAQGNYVTQINFSTYGQTGARGTYRVEPQRMLLTNELGQTTVAQYRLRGNQLVMTISDFQQTQVNPQVTFTRQGGGSGSGMPGGGAGQGGGGGRPQW
jgi:uncharacterized membrane protein YgcG